MATGKPTFGVLLPTRGVILQARDVPDLSPIFDLAQAAEDTGYDSVWVGDSVLAKSRLDALTTMGALSGHTRRVKIGTAVLLATLRHNGGVASAVFSPMDPGQSISYKETIYLTPHSFLLQNKLSRSPPAI